MKDSLFDQTLVRLSEPSYPIGLLTLAYKNCMTLAALKHLSATNKQTNKLKATEEFAACSSQHLTIGLLPVFIENLTTNDLR